MCIRARRERGGRRRKRGRSGKRGSEGKRTGEGGRGEGSGKGEGGTRADGMRKRRAARALGVGLKQQQQPRPHLGERNKSRAFKRRLDERISRRRPWSSAVTSANDSFLWPRSWRCPRSVSHPVCLFIIVLPCSLPPFSSPPSS